MRTPEQIEAKLRVEKASVEILMGQLAAKNGDIGLYNDVINFLADGVRSLENAIEELEDLNEPFMVLNDVYHSIDIEGGNGDD